MKTREEQYPLLLFFVGSNNGEGYRNENRRCFRGRFETITTGASSVMNQWPNYVSSCWISTIIFGVCLLMGSLMLMTIMNPLRPPPMRLPRCVKKYGHHDNETVHLIHDNPKWKPHQLEELEEITGAYPGFKINLIAIHPSHHRHNNDSKSRSNQTFESLIFKAIFGNSEETIEDFIGQHLYVAVQHENYQTIFENTPLNYKWRWMTPKLRQFSARIIQLWQFGGVSYDLSSQIENFTVAATSFNGGELIRGGLVRFQNLSSTNTITAPMVSVDPYGYHMESKIPCHSFFGRVLMILKNSSGFVSVRKILKEAMKIYCRMGALDPRFCPSFTL